MRYYIVKGNKLMGTFTCDPKNLDLNKYPGCTIKEGIPPSDLAQYESPSPEVKDPTYDILRHNEYPGIKTQLDMLYHDMDQGLIAKSPTWYNAIKSIKDKYPKES